VVGHTLPRWAWLTARAYPALIKIAREEGVGAWYRGFAPKVLRLGPGGGVLLLGEFLLLFDSPTLIFQLSRLFRLCSGTTSVPHMFRSPREPACISRQIYSTLWSLMAYRCSLARCFLLSYDRCKYSRITSLSRLDQLEYLHPFSTFFPI
jgi:hypothetical protein